LAVIPLLLGSGYAQYAHAEAAPPWHQFWKAYQQYFIDPASGRVIDWHEGDITTSEGQSYALFFALVDNAVLYLTNCWLGPRMIWAKTCRPGAGANATMAPGDYSVPTTLRTLTFGLPMI
jgi:hypothetical protein